MMILGLRRALTATGVLLALPLGCTQEDDLPKGTNGVNDVKLACEIRTQWVRDGNDCSMCEAAAISPRCDCPTFAAFGAACEEQQKARRQACAEGIDDCVAACQRSDCACIEACYADDASCKVAAGARDGCVAEVCADHCK